MELRQFDAGLALGIHRQGFFSSDLLNVNSSALNIFCVRVLGFGI